MPKTKNLRMDLPLKFHRALEKLAKKGGTKKSIATDIVKERLIRDGLVTPSKIEMKMYN